MIIGGLDVGTTGCKIALYNEEAELVEVYYYEYEAIHKDGCHEIDFGDIRHGVMQLLKAAVGKHKIDALGVTSFGETFALLDDEDRVLAPSMLYTDPRGEKECEYLCRKVGEERLTLLSGVKPHPMYSISKLMWFKSNMPELFSKCRRVLLGEDFIVYSLTGAAQIDYSLAARTGAFDIEGKSWITEVFSAAGLDTALMSEPVPPGTAAGKIKPEIKAELGIDYDITVVNGCHDQAAAMIGSGVFNTDQAMDGTGTVECMPVILTEKPTDTDFYRCGYSVVPYIGRLYACYALSFTGGATLKWFRDNFAADEHKKAQQEGKNIYAELDRRAGSEPTGLLVLPHFAGAATPYMDNCAKAAFIGITLETTKYDLYRALMEGTSYEMLLNFNKMSALTGKIGEIRASGGGASSDIWLQIKADILNSEITALAVKEIGAAGTAALVGKAVGVYSELETAVAKMAPVRRVFAPNSENTEKYSELYKKYERLYSAVKEVSK